MAPTCRPRLDLEMLIPKSILDNVERECSRPECRSKDVVMRYFNNNKYDQPRFLCNGCKRLFTLGGNLRESYRNARNKTKKATSRTKSDNLEAEGAEIGESSGLARAIQRETRSSRQGLAQATNRTASGIESKGKSIEEIEDEEETDDSEEETDEEIEEIESETEDEDMDEDENEDEDGEPCPLDLNKLLHEESNVAREDEVMHQVEESEQVAEETEELVDSSLQREGNVDGIPIDEVLEATEETPMALETTLREEHHPNVLSKIKLLRLKAREHLLDAQTTLEEVFIEKVAMEMELEWNEIEQRQEQEKRALYPHEEMLYALKQGVAKIMSSWRIGPLTVTRWKMLDAREASLNKVGQDVESLAREVDEMENTLVPHATMVRIEKKAKRLWDRVVALAD